MISLDQSEHNEYSLVLRTADLIHFLGFFKATSLRIKQWISDEQESVVYQEVSRSIKNACRNDVVSKTSASQGSGY